ncbi:MAG: hypothetical protein GTN84_00570 [Hydrogenophaga sp.]|uniref:DUF6036 family nucleotidyltransferase n=1 Tax=Hydrogenophaga sp. TaxID=1904254 RepID=UPI0016B0851E|nr:DUF6036 family nucleotidyltransferase [Hydrogenophaga sp.]NIM39645.1 hypothetical protein [Hydrogenophaga sp.]NIN24849.1 hypothetical protein [Hydrogenophaga sp.]NIN29361.1 hypothetical protein [Hydrogenophaga sp.]NIN53884.1 hypothetical protein [Hydrogenophaga sp.]NIO50088.1 hypothetical protein [Hydrogenophaga sp.]
MTRDELEHIIRASGDVTDQYEFIIVGSQSILGPIPHPEAVFTMSAEADIYPLNAPELAERIEGALGEGSRFHEMNGYYAQGVGPETAVLPAGWMDRVHRVQSAGTNHRVGYCLAVVDLFLSKAAASREKDREFCMALLEHGHVRAADALALVDSMPLDGDQRRRLMATIRRWVKALRDTGHILPDPSA